jgi:hypothetical protein
MFTRVPAAQYSGPHRTGSIEAPFAAMVTALGWPHRTTDADYPDDDYKTDVCWMVESVEHPGSVVTIWNYKNGPNYNGGEGAVEDISDFSVYTNDLDFFHEVVGAIKAVPVEPSLTDQLMAITTILGDPAPHDDTSVQLEHVTTAYDDALETIAALRARVAELEGAKVKADALMEAVVAYFNKRGVDHAMRKGNEDIGDMADALSEYGPISVAIH